jgi:hypothetical protein
MNKDIMKTPEINWHVEEKRRDDVEHNIRKREKILTKLVPSVKNQVWEVTHNEYNEMTYYPEFKNENDDKSGFRGTSRNKFLEAIKKHPDAKIWFYDDILFLSGSRGFYLISNDQIVTKHVIAVS